MGNALPLATSFVLVTIEKLNCLKPNRDGSIKIKRFPFKKRGIPFQSAQLFGLWKYLGNRIRLFHSGIYIVVPKQRHHGNEDITKDTSCLMLTSYQFIMLKNIQILRGLAAMLVVA